MASPPAHTGLRLALGRQAPLAKKLAAGFAGSFLFILALQLLKTSAAALGGLLAGIGVDDPASALGFGWLFAYVVLSGSPVAALSLSFFASGVIDDLQTFAMIAGSRFGASFVVLLIGFVYMLRKKRGGRGLEIGVLALLATFFVYGLALPLGAGLLVTDALVGFEPRLPTGLFDVIDLVYTPIVEAITGSLPTILAFVLGIGIILLAFHLFDKALPDLASDAPVRGLERHVYRPSVMFALGAIITLLTLSVSVSLGILVPLSAKGIARRENVVPYIMGANITTFVDTLLATLLLGAPGAFTIVLVEMLAVAAVSVFILVVVYSPFESFLLRTSRAILATRTRLTVFILVIFVVPLLLLAL